MMTVRSIT